VKVESNPVVRLVRLLFAVLAATPVSATTLVFSLFVLNGYVFSANPHHSLNTEWAALCWILFAPLVWIVSGLIALSAYLALKTVGGRSLTTFVLAGLAVGAVIGTLIYILLPPRDVSRASLDGFYLLIKEATGFGLAGLAASASLWAIRRPDRDLKA
jgi:hypothetical protein